jgi:hypothetical protein
MLMRLFIFLGFVPGNYLKTITQDEYNAHANSNANSANKGGGGMELYSSVI